MPSLYIPTTDAQISNAFLATLNAAPGATYLAQAKSLGVAAAAQVLINATGKTTAATLATQIATNLGLTGDAKTIAENYLVTQINAAGGTTKFGAGLVTALDFFAGLRSDATFGTAASTYVDRVNSAVTYSNVSTNTSTDLSVLASAVSSTGATAGSTFTFTTSADEFLPTSTGTSQTTSGNDTFNAGAGRLNSTDNVNGGAGTDTLNATLDAAVAPVIANVEVLNLSMRGGSLDMTDVSGETTVNILGTQSGAVIGLTAAATLNFTDPAFSDQIRVALSDDSGTADSVTLVANGASAFTLSMTGLVETLNLVASGNLILGNSSNYTTNVLYSANAGSGLGTINVSGSNSASVTLALGGTAASGITGLSAIRATALEGGLTLNYEVDDSIVIAGGLAGDTINMGSGIDTQDSVDGGAGTDTVAGTVAQSVATIRPTLTNVETLSITFSTAGSLDLRNSTALTTLNVAGTAIVTVNQIGDQVSTIGIRHTSDDDIALNWELNANTNHTISVGNITNTGNGLTIGGITETVNTGTVTLVGEGRSANVMSALTVNAADAVVIRNSQSLSMGAINASNADSVNISAAAALAFTSMGAASATTLVLRNSSTGDTVGGVVTLGNDAASITLDTYDLTLSGIAAGTNNTGATFTVNLTVNGSSTAVINDLITEDGNASALDVVSVTIGGAGDATLTVTSAKASAATAAVTIDAQSLGGSLTLAASAANSGYDFYVNGGGSGASIAVGAGTDTIIGGASADTIEGGDGNDEIRGGAGADVFVYVSNTTGETGNAATATTDGYDVILDFGTADVIRFANLSANNSGNFGSSNVGATTALIAYTATISGTTISSANLGAVAVFQRGSDVVVQVAIGSGVAAVTDNVVEIVLQGENFNTAGTLGVSFANSALEISNIVVS